MNIANSRIFLALSISDLFSWYRCNTARQKKDRYLLYTRICDIHVSLPCTMLLSLSVTPPCRRLYVVFLYVYNSTLWVGQCLPSMSAAPISSFLNTNKNLVYKFTLVSGSSVWPSLIFPGTTMSSLMGWSTYPIQERCCNFLFFKCKQEQEQLSPEVCAIIMLIIASGNLAWLLLTFLRSPISLL